MISSCSIPPRRRLRRAPALLLLLLPTLPSVAAPPDDGAALMERFLANQRAGSEMAFIRMERLVEGERVDERRFLALYQANPDGSSDYLVRLVRPAEVEGVALLSKVATEGELEQFLYLPSVGEVRPLATPAQAGAFLGSDFSYADLVREIPGQQHYTRRPDAFVQGADCHVVRATPREADSPYGFRDLYLEKNTLNLLQAVHFDADGKLLKTLRAYGYGDPEIFGNSTRPHRAVMESADGRTATIFTVIVGRIGESFPAEMFTPAFIEDWTPEETEEFMFRFSFEVPAGTP